MNKTIYIREEDVPIWERARELAGDKLAPAIVAGLKRFIADKEAEEAEARGYERIEVSYKDSVDHHLPKRKAFYGKWIFSPSAPIYPEEQEAPVYHNFAVALTPKGAVVIFSWTENEDTRHSEIFAVYSSLEAAAADRRVNYAVCKAVEARGVPVEELDI